MKNKIKTTKDLGYEKWKIKKMFGLIRDEVRLQMIKDKVEVLDPQNDYDIAIKNYTLELIAEKERKLQNEKN